MKDITFDDVLSAVRGSLSHWGKDETLVRAGLYVMLATMLADAASGQV